MIEKDIIIQENFLAEEEFDELKTIMMGDTFIWTYTDGIDFESEYSELDTHKRLHSSDDLEADQDKFMFVHTFYISGAACSPYIKILKPIIDKIKVISVIRIKANLLTRTPNIVENVFHVDHVLPEKKLKQLTTSIFYVNTNNGYTKFEDGTKVESVANRLVSFPANMKHTGTSCTDEKIRIIINFNYWK